LTKTEVSEEALRLPVEERLSLAERLWDSVEEDAPSLPLHDWQKKILDERLEAARRNPDAWLTWEEVKARVLASLSKRREA
jgi:putative addiction module component (TIGR02574 family)